MKCVWASAVLMSVLCGGAFCASAQPLDDYAQATSLTVDGGKLTDEQAQALEERLQAKPDDLTIRTKLLGYYMHKRFKDKGARQRHGVHALWIVEHRPETAIAGLPPAGLDPATEPEAYVEARKLWLKTVEEQRDKPAILYNAAQFFLIPDHDKAEELLKKGEALQPDDPRWPEQLGHLYAFDILGLDGTANAAAAAKALAALERALQKTDDRSKGPLQIDAARAALYSGDLKKAREYAAAILAAADKPEQAWNRGNAIHRANLVLGHVALREGEVEKAEQYLLEAGKTPGSPQLNSFGPNMALALELLKRDRKDAVIAYLRLCGKFWKPETTEAWIKQVEVGLTPDFGANLRY
jgi:hypothetical protein